MSGRNLVRIDRHQRRVLTFFSTSECHYFLDFELPLLSLTEEV